MSSSILQDPTQISLHLWGLSWFLQEELITPFPVHSQHFTHSSTVLQSVCVLYHDDLLTHLSPSLECEQKDKVDYFPRAATTSATKWLRTTEMYSFVVLEAKSLKSRCLQGRAPCNDSREGCFFVFPSSWWLLAVLGVFCLHVLHHSNLSVFPMSLCPNLPLLFLLKTPVPVGPPY